MAGPNPSVLGSNAPALRECANTRKGVLCDSSGNVGSSNLECNVMLPKYNRYEAQARSLSDIPQHHSEQGTYKLKRGKRREIFIRHFTSAELLSPRYLAYRQKQRTSFVEGSTTEQVWSDELEEAFQQGTLLFIASEFSYTEVSIISVASVPQMRAKNEVFSWQTVRKKRMDHRLHPKHYRDIADSETSI